jgi:hypothetical protein
VKRDKKARGRSTPARAIHDYLLILGGGDITHSGDDWLAFSAGYDSNPLIRVGAEASPRVDLRRTERQVDAMTQGE